MIAKLGVSLEKLRPELLLLEPVVDDVFRTFKRSAVVTSTNDGVHKLKSLHFRDAAFDLRMNYFNSVSEQRECHSKLRAAVDEKYPGYYDVLLEYEGTYRAHVHIELSPKGLKAAGMEG